MIRAIPPKADELEVSVLGPGVGECVLIHLGDGRWAIVDSCVAAGTRTPAALEYLSSIGVDIATAVRLVVVTHWHRDHMRGVSEIFRNAPAATLYCSSALCTEEFIRFVEANRLRTTDEVSSTTAEFAALMDELRRRAPVAARSGSIGPHWTAADQLLYRRSVGSDAVEVHALSPSPGTQSRAFRELANELGHAPLSPLQGANDVSVVLWVRAGAAQILLGADLEHTRDPLTGWNAIVASTTRPSGQAQVVKIPHHGSENANCDQMWTDLMNSTPLGVVTAYSSGIKPLPSQDDVDRIRRQTAAAYCTTPPTGWKPRNRGGAVEKMIGSVARNRRVVRAQAGHVRMRARISASDPVFTVECFGTALPLAS